MTALLDSLDEDSVDRRSCLGYQHSEKDEHAIDNEIDVWTINELIGPYLRAVSSVKASLSISLSRISRFIHLLPTFSLLSLF